MRQDETNSLFRMKLIRSLSAADTTSRGPLTYEDGVWQSNLKARRGVGLFSFYGGLMRLSNGRAAMLRLSWASWDQRALERTSTVGRT
jgi:hypothetical protein